MYSVKVTVTPSSNWTPASDERKVKSFGRKAERRIQRAVEEERSNHAYTNRTGAAESETRLSIVSDDGAGNVEFDAEMGVEYASYLQGDWSQFDALIEEATADVDQMFESL